MAKRSMADDDPHFYRRREREERDAAARSDDPAIAAIHADMARRYAALATSPPVSARPDRLRLSLA